jgi:uncharacterized protein YndB with AHSA1/START domain
MRRKVLMGCSFVFSMPLFFAAVATTTGFMLSAEHTVTLSAVLPAERQAVWDVMTNVDNIFEWNPFVEKSVLLEPVDGKRVWRETDPAGGAISFREVEVDAPSQWRTEVFDVNAPYAAQWIYTLTEEDGDKTRLTIAETGTVGNPFLRFLMRFIVGNEQFQRTYFESLAKHFGDDAVRIEHAPEAS